MTREWLDTLGTLLGAIATVLGAIFIPIFIFKASNEISESQLDAQLEAENERSKQSTLQRYLDQMGTLIIDKDLRTAEDSEVRTLARARTATVIQRLDADGNRNVVRFLNEASLTGAGQSSLSLLAEADLRGAHLEGVDLSTMDLRSANLRNARLKDADLSGANLSDADLSHASLSGATLIGADMSDASLRHANLSNTSLYQADLNDADLSRATLSGNLELVSLNGADLYGADLSGADLDGADMRNSALSGANLRNASLWSSILVDAGLSGADLSNADLSNADLNRAHLHGIFEDDFSDTSSGWDTGTGSETEPYATEYHTDRFRIYNPPPGNTLMSFNRSVRSEIKDVSVEVDASVSGNISQNRGSSWGILCRSDDQNKDMYVLGIFADGTSAIYKLENNNWKELSSREPTDAFRSGADTNHLRADCSGSKLALYINDRKLLDAAEVPGFDPGKQIGLFVQDPQEGEAIDILFDNFEVVGPKAKGLASVNYHNYTANR